MVQIPFLPAGLKRSDQRDYGGVVQRCGGPRSLCGARLPSLAAPDLGGRHARQLEVGAIGLAARWSRRLTFSHGCWMVRSEGMSDDNQEWKAQFSCL